MRTPAHRFGIVLAFTSVMFIAGCGSSDDGPSSIADPSDLADTDIDTDVEVDTDADTDVGGGTVTDTDADTDNDIVDDDPLEADPTDTPADPETVLLEADVVASEGGVFTSDDGTFSIDIPAGALSQDTSVSVVPTEGLANTSANMAPAGSAFIISFADATLASAAMVSLTVDAAPTHPELAETAMIEDGEFVRSPANFFRASDNTVLSMINSGGTLQPVIRTLQTTSGDMVDRGLDVFLNSTFGNENFFGGVVGLQELLNNLAPSAAVGVGAQVDISRVPEEIVAVLTSDDFEGKQAALESPEVTRALLRADAVVGVRAFYDDDTTDIASSAGITCAICHATVTPTEFELSEGVMTALPIGPLQTDGLPNTAMDVGTILSLTPFATAAGQETIDTLQAYGAGRFDARALPDNPLEDNALNPTSIPPLWNLLDLGEQGYGLNWDGQFGSDEVPNFSLASRGELVFDLVMHANGAFGTESSSVPLTLASAPSEELVAALVAAEDETPGNDIDEQSMLDIEAWQQSLTSPAPGSFDEALAEEGFRLFYGEAQCDSCHLTAEFTGPVFSAGIVLVPPIGDLASGIKTPPLRGISSIPPYFHDDSAATLEEVVEIYSGRIVPCEAYKRT